MSAQILAAVNQCHICLPLLTEAQSDDTRPSYFDAGGASFSGPVATSFVANFSQALTQRLQLQPGDFVALAAQSSSVMFLSMLGALDTGAIVAPLNWRWSSSEVKHALHLTQARALLVDAACLPIVAQALQEAHTTQLQPALQLIYICSDPDGPVPSPCTCSVWDLITWFKSQTADSSMRAARAQPQLFHDRLSRHQHGPDAPSAVQAQHAYGMPGRSAVHHADAYRLQLRSAPDGAAMMVFTSGTTGASKGVILSHAAFHSQSLVKLALVGTDATDTYLHTAPLFHIGGLSSAFAAVMARAAHVFLPKFTAADVLAAVKSCSVSSMIAVPAMLQDMIALADQHAGGSKLGHATACASMTKLLVGAGSMHDMLLAEVRRVFPNARLLSAYGMTEATSSITFNMLQPSSARPSGQRLDLGIACSAAEMCLCAAGVCVGYPAPGVQVHIMPHADAPVHALSSAENARTSEQHAAVHNAAHSAAAAAAMMQQPLPAWCVGEVQTRGPHTMLRYHADPHATRTVLSHDGWLATGDLGFLDSSGALWLVGRAKDMIKSGGENVLAAEVERVLLRHPGVAGAVVVGLPHTRLGEQVACLLMLSPGWWWAAAPALRNIASPPQCVPSSVPAQEADSVQQQQQVHNTSPISGGIPKAQTHGSGEAHQSLLDLSALQAWCRQAGLAGYKLPRAAAALPAGGVLPLNASGKIIKTAVREQLAALLQHGPKSRL